MDQITVNATEDFLRDSLAKSTLRITELEEYISAYQKRSLNTATELQRMRDAMHEFTMEQLDEEALTQYQAGEIASICGFELVKEVEVEVSVTYNLTLQVPHGEDVESIVNDIDFESVSYNSDTITWLSTSVDRVDFQQGATKWT